MKVVSVFLRKQTKSDPFYLAAKENVAVKIADPWAAIMHLLCRFLFPYRTNFVFMSPFGALGVEVPNELFCAKRGVVDELVGIGDGF